EVQAGGVFLPAKRRILTMLINLVLDCLLVMGFGIQHSLFATFAAKNKVKRLLSIDTMTWRAVQTLFNALYILTAAVFWRPVNIVIWNLTGTTGILVAAIGV